MFILFSFSSTFFLFSVAFSLLPLKSKHETVAHSASLKVLLPSQALQQCLAVMHIPYLTVCISRSSVCKNSGVFVYVGVNGLPLYNSNGVVSMCVRPRLRKIPGSCLCVLLFSHDHNDGVVLLL